MLNTESGTLLFTHTFSSVQHGVRHTLIYTQWYYMFLSAQAHSYLHKGVLHFLECSTRSQAHSYTKGFTQTWSRAHSYLHKGVLHFLECSTRSRHTLIYTKGYYTFFLNMEWHTQHGVNTDTLLFTQRGITLSRVLNTESGHTLIYTKGYYTFLSAQHGVRHTLIYTKGYYTFSSAQHGVGHTLIYTKGYYTFSSAQHGVGTLLFRGITHKRRYYKGVLHFLLNTECSYLHKGVLHFLECSTRSQAHSY